MDTRNELGGRTLGLLLAAAPDEQGFRHALGLAGAALASGVVVHVFCFHEAVRGLGDARLQTLRQAGLRLHVCSLSARRCGVEIGDLGAPAGMALASQLAAQVDRLVSFT